MAAGLQHGVAALASSASMSSELKTDSYPIVGLVFFLQDQD